MSQTSYSIAQPAAVSGQLGTAEPYSALTFNNPVDTIAFGRMVAKVSGDANGCELPDGGSAVLLGVAIRKLHTTDNDYQPENEVGVMRRGQIWVEVEQTVTPDSPVYVRHTDPGALGLGVFRADADTADAVLVPEARYLVGASANGVALLDINLD